MECQVGFCTLLGELLDLYLLVIAFQVMASIIVALSLTSALAESEAVNEEARVRSVGAEGRRLQLWAMTCKKAEELQSAVARRTS